MTHVMIIIIFNDRHHQCSRSYWQQMHCSTMVTRAHFGYQTNIYKFFPLVVIIV